MKIIHIIPSLWNGGAEKLVVDLSNELSKTEEVIICSFKNVQEGMFFVKTISAKVKLVTLSKKQGFDLIFFFRLFRFIHSEKPDVINTHLSAINYCFISIFLFRKTKVFHTIHSTPNTEEPNKLRRFIRKNNFKKRKIIPICISKNLQSAFIKTYGNLPSVIIYNGIRKLQNTEKYSLVVDEVKRLKKNDATFVFIIVGNYTYPKNLELITTVFSTLYQEEKKVILLIIGKDVSVGKSEWGKISEKKAVNTYMLGEKENVADYLSCADAFCLCSKYEGLPITILEAFSMGVPVLSTPVGGVPDIVCNAVHGFLSKDTSVQEYYDMIKSFLSLPKEKIEEIKKTNIQHFNDNFTIEKTAANYLEIYKKTSK
jgi:glycosyltransferase involved in cell wall biosynthesis